MINEELKRDKMFSVLDSLYEEVNILSVYRNYLVVTKDGEVYEYYSEDDIDHFKCGDKFEKNEVIEMILINYKFMFDEANPDEDIPVEYHLCSHDSNYVTGDLMIYANKHTLGDKYYTLGPPLQKMENKLNMLPKNVMLGWLDSKVGK